MVQMVNLLVCLLVAEHFVHVEASIGSSARVLRISQGLIQEGVVVGIVHFGVAVVGS